MEAPFEEKWQCVICIGHVPRCLFFTRDPDDYVKNPCVFTWFWKVMLLSVVFGLFSIGFLMDFHGEGFCKVPYSSQ